MSSESRPCWNMPMLKTNAGAAYFYSILASKNEHNCGLCDACLAKHSSGLKHGEFEDIRNQIMDILQSPCSSHDLLEALPGDERKKNTKALSYLLAEEVIGQEHGKLYICK